MDPFCENGAGMSIVMYEVSGIRCRLWNSRPSRRTDVNLGHPAAHEHLGQTERMTYSFQTRNRIVDREIGSGATGYGDRNDVGRASRSQIPINPGSCSVRSRQRSYFGFLPIL